MITFDLECSKGHIFEGWFDNLQSFEEQGAKNMISCPYCNDTNIKRIPSPITMKTTVTAEDKRDVNPIDYKRLAKEVVRYINEEFEDLGADFTKEALNFYDYINN